MRDIKLGQRVRVQISGFQGIVVARTDWLWGCIRYGVRPEKLDKDGQPLGDIWFDEDELEILGEVVDPPVAAVTGGPERTTGSTRRGDPGR